MISSEWNTRGWQKHTNPSGEVIRVKTYSRVLPLWDNGHQDMLDRRKALADLLEVPPLDLNCDLEVTVKCNRYRRNGLLLNRILKEDNHDTTK